MLIEVRSILMNNVSSCVCLSNLMPEPYHDQPFKIVTYVHIIAVRCHFNKAYLTGKLFIYY